MSRPVNQNSITYCSCKLTDYRMTTTESIALLFYGMPFTRSQRTLSRVTVLFFCVCVCVCVCVFFPPVFSLFIEAKIK